METMVKRQTCISFSKLLSINKNSSQIISKPKPKIRIIHIYAPEIIKTDATNFRELVQRLTGKPPTTTINDHRRRRRSQKSPIVVKLPPITRSEEEGPTSSGSNRTSTVTVTSSSINDDDGGFFELEMMQRERLVKEELMWSGENNGGFLNGFADFDGFIHELGEFPLMAAPPTLDGF